MRKPFTKKHATDSGMDTSGLKRIKRRRFNRLIIVIVASVVVIGAAVLSVSWYEWALRPLDASNANHVRFTINSGTQPDAIAKQLYSAHLIRSAAAFQIFTRVGGQQNKLQAGTYAFAPNQSVRDIVDRLVSGKTDEFSVTILPGQTLKDIRTMLEGHGYAAAEIDSALNAQYTNALVASRPAGASLEGFFYPDTYNVLSDESLTTIFERIFDHMSDEVASNNLAAGFSAHGLSVYQGITLASIVQREVSKSDDQRNVASVFYNRLDADMVLGSEVTFRYGADLLGVAPKTTLDSPYNLYIKKGLTPTPISNPELSALQAVANPATTKYLYFLSGDDDVTYFAQTDAQHEKNIAEHCKLKCQ